MENIVHKSYHELTNAEKESMKDLFSTEEEFTTLKQMFTTIQNQMKETDEISLPSPAIKRKLDSLYQERFPSKRTSILIDRNKFWYQQNLFKLAAIFVLLLSFVSVWKATQIESTKMAENSPTEKQKVDKPVEKSAEIKESISENSDKLGSKVPTSKVTRSETKEDVEISAEANEEVALAAENKDVSKEENLQFNKITSAASPSVHPDGIYKEMADDDKYVKQKPSTKNAFSVSQHKNLLDLLSSCY